MPKIPKNASNAAAGAGAGPRAVSIASAMGQNSALANLIARVRESEARLAAIRSMLPEALRPHVRPGPLDEKGWTLLAANGSVASKLRQFLPDLEAALRERGWESTPIRVRIQSG